MLPPFIGFFLILYFMSFLIVINSDDWFLVWLGMELNMLSFVFLIYMRNSMVNIESCLKYFFIQSVGSGMLMGMMYIKMEVLIYLGSLILSYKMGAGPFYFWFPSMCSGLNWWSCFFLMSFQKFIPMMLLVMFISWVVWVIIMMSLVFGGLGSFNQSEIKRLIAYSSIHHMGWMMLCMMININVWILYLIMYMFMVFPMILIMYRFEINSMINLKRWKMKWWFLMMMLSMGGMPPFIGFFMKWIAFYYILMMNVMLILMMVVMSVVMFYVYIRLVYDLFLGEKIDYSWGGKKMLKVYIYKIEFMMVIGMMGGCLMGIMVSL